MNLSLTDLSQIFRKRVLLAILALVLVGLILFVIFGLKTQRSEIKKAQVPQEFLGIQPGITTEAEIREKLGQPTTETATEGAKFLQFPSSNQFRPNIIVVKDNKTEVIKKPINTAEKGALAKYTKQFGRPEAVLFGPYSSVGFRVYVFSSSGLAVVASQNNGVVLEEWYFQSMPLSEFLKTVGKSLTTKPSLAP